LPHQVPPRPPRPVAGDAAVGPLHPIALVAVSSRASCHAACMDGVTGILIKLAARLVLFGLVFYIAARKNPKVLVPNKWATPLVALVFALLNTVLYWALTPILNLATLGGLGVAMPFVANLLFLAATVRIFQSKKWLEITSALTYLWLAGILTIAHGLIWFGLDYLPPKL
jgi:hypothetical protein